MTTTAQKVADDAPAVADASAMKLSRLRVERYRSLRHVEMGVEDLNVFIGVNASGKSTILDVLRFLHDAVGEGDFAPAVQSRGGLLNLAWKGDTAQSVEIKTDFLQGATTYTWTVRLERDKGGFKAGETLEDGPRGAPLRTVLKSDSWERWWLSEEKQVKLAGNATACALAAAAADASFTARDVAEAVKEWIFLDPSPFLLRRDWTGIRQNALDPYGRNLAARLYELRQADPARFERVVSATRSILGLPTSIEPKQREDDSFYFVQQEPHLNYLVHQMGVSSGTLRVLAIMTALFGDPRIRLVGIEEPENYVHPEAVAAVVQYLQAAREQMQVLITTHSPTLLDFLDEPAAICTVAKDEDGTHVSREADPQAARKAMEESGFSLGELYQTSGFGR